MQHALNQNHNELVIQSSHVRQKLTPTQRQGARLPKRLMFLHFILLSRCPKLQCNLQAY